MILSMHLSYVIVFIINIKTIDTIYSNNKYIKYYEVLICTI